MAGRDARAAGARAGGRRTRLAQRRLLRGQQRQQPLPQGYTLTIFLVAVQFFIAVVNSRACCSSAGERLLSIMDVSHIRETSQSRWYRDRETERLNYYSAQKEEIDIYMFD